MTEPTRAEKCAALAKAMGWRQGEASGVWFTPANAAELCVYDNPPNPYESAEASRELVAWMADKREYRDKFQYELENDLLTERDGTWGYPVSLFYLTAPLPVIAEAAWRAIQEAK